MKARAEGASGWEDPGAEGRDARPASWLRRAGATAVDALVLLVPVLLVFAALLPGDLEAEGAVRAATVSAGVYLTAVLLYAPFLMSRQGGRNGQTLGKQIARIRVVREHGGPLDLGSSALREVVVKQLLFGLGYFLLFVPNLLDVLWPLWDAKSQALHDKIVSTRVVRA